MHLTFANCQRDARLTGREPPEAASKVVLAPTTKPDRIGVVSESRYRSPQ